MLFLLLVFYNNTEAKVKWEPIKTPGKISQIIGGHSLNNYWVLDNQNTILHFFHGKWISYPLKRLFPTQSLRQYNPILVQDNLLIVLLVDLNWNTHFAEILDGKIIHFSYVAETPLYRVTKVANSLYATGDFGIVLKLENNHWKKIPSPITSHIFSATTDQKGKLWLGTFGQGIFSWDGTQFREYPIPQEVTHAFIPEMKFIQDTLYINTSKEFVYKFYDNDFHKIAVDQSPFAKAEKFTQNGYYQITKQNNETRWIPYLYKIRSFQELPDGHALLLTQSLQLFYDHKVNGNFFLDFTPTVGLEGPNFSFSGINPKPGESRNTLYRITSPGIVFSDFNNDHFPDILLFNVSDKRRPYLFLNNQENSFTNFAIPLGLNKLSFNGLFSYAYDLNGDYIPEIISSDYNNGNYFLNIYENISAHYQLSFSYQVPKEFSIRPIQNVSVTDIDRDGDLDLALVFGYSQSGKGSILFLKNDGYGNFNQIDSSANNLFKGWNNKALHADFNNDGLDDILVVRNWRANAIFYKENVVNWTEYLLDTLNSEANQRKGEALAFDYDNDGDLDIFALAAKPFISVLQNNGKGNFINITEKMGLSILNAGEKSGQITSGDFDNNGFIDLFVSVNYKGKIKNYIFLNDSSRRFIDRSAFMGIAKGKAQFAAVGDIDNDGDLDLYGYKEGSNVLWLNNLDSNNFLRLKLFGIKSNTMGLGAKIWVYESGHLNDPKYLAGYRQVGSMVSGRIFQNEMISHFGLKPDKQYDIKVKFSGAKTKILKNISPGKLIEVADMEPPLAWFYTLDNKAYILLNNEEFRSYFLIIALGILVMLFSVIYGTRKFQWDVPLTSIIIFLNLIIFGILLTTLSSDEPLIKYYIPLAVALLGSFGPIGFFLWIRNRMNLKSSRENNYLLFQALLSFSHGAWALSNLNSLQLFFENLSVTDLDDEVYKAPFEKRKETFIKLTLPVVEEIIRLIKNLNINLELALDIEKFKNLIVQFLKSDFTHLNHADKENFSTTLFKFKESLSKLKFNVFANHSCYPVKVIENLRDELNQLIANKQIKFNIISFLTEEDAVLMDAAGLASILDNCIQNALKAMAETKDKELTIKLIKGDLRVFIEITDNGRGIPSEKFQQLFENGYSTTNSTGYGLFYSKETLSKYGGRIYVKTSIPHQKTTMVIELQKGIKK